MPHTYRINTYKPILGTHSTLMWNPNIKPGKTNGFSGEPDYEEGGNLSPHVCLLRESPGDTSSFSMQVSACTAGQISPQYHIQVKAGRSFLKNYCDYTDRTSDRWPLHTYINTLHTPRLITVCMHTNPWQMIICVCMCKCLFSVINILQIILWPRPFFPALWGAPPSAQPWPWGGKVLSPPEETLLIHQQRRRPRAARDQRQEQWLLFSGEIWVWASKQLTCSHQI